jgi:hypothetical protein
MYSKLFLFLVLLPLGIQAQSLDQILSNHYNAMGEENLEAIRSVEMELIERSVMGNQRIYKIAKKRPGKIRKETVVRGMTYLELYDGNKGLIMESWNNDSVRETNPQEQALLEIESTIGSPLKLGAKEGHELELLGVENLADKKYSVLRLTFYDNYMVDFYVDQSSQLIYKYIAYKDLSEEVDFQYFYKDFKRLGSFVLPYSYEKRKKGQETIYYTVQDLVFGSGASDSLYVLEDISE